MYVFVGMVVCVQVYVCGVSFVCIQVEDGITVYLIF